MTLRLALLLLLAQPLAAQPTIPLPDAAPALPPEATLAPRLQPTPPAARAPRPAAERPVPDALAEMRQDPRYRYDRPVAERPSLWARFWTWVVEKVLMPLFQASGTRGGQGFWLVVAVLVLAAVAFRLTQTGLGGIFGRRSRTTGDGVDPLLGVDDIATVDLPALLDAALARREWRAAVRLRYLVALQRLDARGLVQWTRDKTNRTFVREAQSRGGADIGRAFSDVTRAFETVWYGGATVDAARWARIDARFERFDAALAEAPRPARGPAEVPA